MGCVMGSAGRGNLGRPPMFLTVAPAMTNAVTRCHRMWAAPTGQMQPYEQKLQRRRQKGCILCAGRMRPERGKSKQQSP